MKIAVISLSNEGARIAAQVAAHWEAFRATEIALRAQCAAERGKPQRLAGSDYRSPSGAG